MNGHAGGVRAAYDTEASFVFVIGADGIILYRGFFDDAAVRTAVDTGLAAISTSAVAQTLRFSHEFAGGSPNPFNPATKLSFSLDARATPLPARLEIIDLQGRLIKVLLSESITAGRRYEAVWNGRDAAGRAVASGVYLARLQVGDWHATRSLTLVK